MTAFFWACNPRRSVPLAACLFALGAWLRWAVEREIERGAGMGFR